MHPNLFKPLFMGLMLMVSGYLTAQWPGGVSRYTLWLKGSAETAGTLNFNPPAIANSGAAIKITPGPDWLRRVTIFTVYSNTAGNEEQAVWQITGSQGDLRLSTRQVASQSAKTQLAYTNNSQPAAAGNTQAIIHTYTGRQPKRPSGDDAEKNVFLNIAKSNTAGPQLAEFILYEKLLSETETAKAETYLALKYGVTIAKNYRNGKGETIWNIEKDQPFSNHIAGIGRDDKTTLYQKQATPQGLHQALVIGAGGIAPTNSNNTAVLNNGDYLVWGDNAKSFLSETERHNSNYILLERKWLMRPSGSTAHTVATEIQADTKILFPGFIPSENIYLVIDRSGRGDFIPENCSYTPAGNITPEGIASFKQVVWDADGSGRDHFTFAVKPGLTANNEAAGNTSFQVYPNPAVGGLYKLAITLEKPAAILVQIYDGQQRLIETRKASGAAFYLIPGRLNAPPGAYTVRLTTPDAELNRKLIVQ